MKVLIVDDDEALRSAVSIMLHVAGYETCEASDGISALKIFDNASPDLVIMDVMLPRLDGFEACAVIRRICPTVPILFLSAKSDISDKAIGYQAGGDDYLTKPFGTAELLARVRTAIRHTRTTSANSEIAREGTYTVGEMTIDYNKHQVLVRGENVHLTLSEFRIVALLGKFAGKVLTYDYIIKELWGPRAGGDNQILRVNMANIRRKLEKDPAQPKYIFTEVGVGYRMQEDSSEND